MTYSFTTRGVKTKSKLCPLWLKWWLDSERKGHVMVNRDMLLFKFGLRTGDKLPLPRGPCVPVKALFHLNYVQHLSKEP